MEMDEQGAADREGAKPEERVEPGPIQQDTSVYFADVGPPAAAPRPPRAGSVTKYLGVALIVLVAFSGGIFVQKRAASAAYVTQVEAAGGDTQGAGDAGGALRVAGADAVFGRVIRISGSTIYVTDEQGNVVKITTSSSSQFSKTSSASIGDLRPGDNVAVQGRPGTGGSFAATVVNIGGPSDGFLGEGGQSSEASPGSGTGDNG